MQPPDQISSQISPIHELLSIFWNENICGSKLGKVFTKMVENKHFEHFLKYGTEKQDRQLYRRSLFSYVWKGKKLSEKIHRKEIDQTLNSGWVW